MTSGGNFLSRLREITAPVRSQFDLIRAREAGLITAEEASERGQKLFASVVGTVKGSEGAACCFMPPTKPGVITTTVCRPGILKRREKGVGLRCVSAVPEGAEKRLTPDESVTGFDGVEVIPTEPVPAPQVGRGFPIGLVLLAGGGLFLFFTR